jgi:hypothetical protein
MEKVYEAVMIDEESCRNEGLLVKEEAEATSTITGPCTEEIAYNTFVPPIHRNLSTLSLVQFGYSIVSVLLIELNVSRSVKMFELWCFWIFTAHTEKWTLLIFYFLLITACQHIELHSSSAMWILYVAAELSFIGLIFLKLYISYGGIQIYFVRFAVLKWSGVPMPDAVAFTVDVICICNFLIFCFLAMDGKISMTKRNSAEVLILMTLLVRCARMDIGT